MLNSSPGPNQKSVCGRCGSVQHYGKECPAIGKRCNNCGGIGHFKSCCRKPVSQGSTRYSRAVTYDEEAEAEYDFGQVNLSLDQVTQIEKKPPAMYPSTIVKVKVNGTLSTWRCDSGADANIQDEAEFKKTSAQLQPSKATLRPFGENAKPLTVLGQYTAEFCANGRSVKDTVYVVTGQGKVSLLSKFTAFDLGILEIKRPSIEKNIGQLNSQSSDTSVTHLSFEEMRNLFTPDKQIKEILEQSRSDDPHVTAENLQQCYQDVFNGVGKHKYRQVKLHIDDSVKPVAETHRRTPYAIREAVSELLENLEKNDVIEKVDGPTDWVSNMHITAKPGFNSSTKVEDRIRMTLNAAQANKAIHRTRHVTPTVHDLRKMLEGDKIFSKVDMNLGYNQLELSPESRAITTFHTHDGLRRYKRLCFGLNAASEIFHEEIHQLLMDIPNVDNIHDDIIIHAKSQHEHDLALARLLQRLADCGLTLKASKCLFNQTSIKFYGLVFSEAGVSPDPEKVRAIKEASRPNSKKDVESFLGFVGWNSDFIGPNYANIVAPLRQCCSTGKFVWSEECEDAFNKLKSIISSDKVLAPFDPEKPTALMVDAAKASEECRSGGVGSMLVQFHADQNCWRAVNVNSRTLKDAELNYSQIEAESLAVVIGVIQNHMYLYGLKHFEVYTDHKPLVPLYNNANRNLPPRIMNHKMYLQGYSFTLVFRPGAGAKNPVDYPSRHAIKDVATVSDISDEVECHIGAIVRSDLPNAITVEKIQQAYRNDATMQKLIDAIKEGHIGKNSPELSAFKSVFDELAVANEIILRGERIVLPKSLQQAAVNLAHEGHQGVVRTKAYLRSMIWFPSLDRLLEETIDGCLTCQGIKPNRGATAPLRMTTLPQYPWQHVAMDFFSVGQHTDEHILVVQDRYSRYPVVDFVSTVSSKAVIPKLDKILSDFGVPEQADSDNGSPFPAEEFDEYMKWMGIYHHKITPEWPAANHSETFMKNLKMLLQACTAEKLNYKQEVFKFLRAFRATPHPSTGKSPAELLFNGRPYKTGLPAPVTKKIPLHDDSVRARDSQQKEKMKVYADARRQTALYQPLHEGDDVLVSQKQPNKATSRFNTSPYKVVNVKGSMVTARHGDHEITRNTSFFKKLRVPVNTFAKRGGDVLVNPAPKVTGSAAVNPATKVATSAGTATPSLQSPAKPPRPRRQPAWMRSGTFTT